MHTEKKIVRYAENISNCLKTSLTYPIKPFISKEKELIDFKNTNIPPLYFDTDILISPVGDIFYTIPDHLHTILNIEQKIYDTEIKILENKLKEFIKFSNNKDNFYKNYYEAFYNAFNYIPIFIRNNYVGKLNAKQYKALRILKLDGIYLGSIDGINKYREYSDQKEQERIIRNNLNNKKS